MDVKVPIVTPFIVRGFGAPLSREFGELTLRTVLRSGQSPDVQFGGQNRRPLFIWFTKWRTWSLPGRICGLDRDRIAKSWIMAGTHLHHWKHFEDPTLDPMRCVRCGKCSLSPMRQVTLNSLSSICRAFWFTNPEYSDWIIQWPNAAALPAD